MINLIPIIRSWRAIYLVWIVIIPILACKPGDQYNMKAGDLSSYSIIVALGKTAQPDDRNAYKIYAALPPNTLLTGAKVCFDTAANCRNFAQDDRSVLPMVVDPSLGSNFVVSTKAVRLADNLNFTILTATGLAQSVRIISLNPQNGGQDNSYPQPNSLSDNTPAAKAIQILNQFRARSGLNPVILDANLSNRCLEWSKKMASGMGLRHDSSVYGTDERENIAGGGGTMNVETAMRMWENSSGHANAMLDRGFPRGAKAGYGEYRGYACLRICPDRVSKVCN